MPFPLKSFYRIWWSPESWEVEDKFERTRHEARVPPDFLEHTKFGFDGSVKCPREDLKMNLFIHFLCPFQTMYDRLRRKSEHMCDLCLFAFHGLLRAIWGVSSRNFCRWTPDCKTSFQHANPFMDMLRRRSERPVARGHCPIQFMNRFFFLSWALAIFDVLMLLPLRQGRGWQNTQIVFHCVSFSHRFLPCRSAFDLCFLRCSTKSPQRRPADSLHVRSF